MTETVSSIPITLIKVDEKKRIRQADQGAIERLAKSISQVGLMNPITVTTDNTLVAGLHRLEACKRLGWESIPVTTVKYADELTRELAEIDENLMRNDLSELMQGIHHARRKRIYEQLHPETKAGGDRKSEERKNQTANLAVCSYAAPHARARGVAARCHYCNFH